ncbi:MAG: PglZ domain-containing protein [Bacteroidales bacterium]|jgi:DNA-binding response OmpR family regulator|nr:PglZ domain-containing protein [Bacteroidales bacterium]
MKNGTILWADDEIELLKPHVLFLEGKGYSVVAVNDGMSAIEKMRESRFDIVFLDEQMPGISGIDALIEIKKIDPVVPVIMITKSEAEDIMEAAIGSQISDYLIKPVNPNQILLTLKKNLNSSHIITQETTTKYQTEFSQLGIEIGNAQCWDDWVAVYKKITYWDLQLEMSQDRAMDEILQMQKQEANASYAKFIQKNYVSWFSSDDEEKPIMSPSLLKEKIFPALKKNETPTVLLVLDNFRYDHWLTLRSFFHEFFTIDAEDLYCSILPTTTQYARNSLFAGLMPLEISHNYPEIWKNDEDDEGKNMFEEQLLSAHLKRMGIDSKFFFKKITAINPSKNLMDIVHQMKEHQFSVIVYNFVDTLSHTRTEMDMIKELAGDESAYRSLIKSWFRHSLLYDVIKEIAHNKCKLFVTTDHGSVRVQHPIKVVGDKTITTNLRYKNGRALKYNPKEVFEIRKPEDAHLPTPHLTSSYIFSRQQDFFAYPNNFNYYARYYKNSFQHGGISLEEMIIPCVELTARE